MQNEKKEREEKEKKQKEKRPKDRIVPWEEMVENERKEKEKEKEREGPPTLAALMGERLLGSMPTDEVGIRPEGPVAPPVGLPTGRPKEYSPVQGVRPPAPWCHNGVFQHHCSTLCSLLACPYYT